MDKANEFIFLSGKIFFLATVVLSTIGVVVWFGNFLFFYNVLAFIVYVIFGVSAFIAWMVVYVDSE